MVNCPPDFKDHPKVINGYSELLSEIFGRERGVGARSAVGMGSLPNNIAVEIEVILELYWFAYKKINSINIINICKVFHI